MPGIGLITNPQSRVNQRDPSNARKLGYLIGAHGVAEATKSLDDLYRVCEEFKKEEIDILGISGGDGTLHHTLTAMIKTYQDQPLPKIAILRGGTMNTVANSFGIVGRAPQLLFELVDKHRRGEELSVRKRAVLEIGDKYGFIFGNGLIYNFLKAYYATGNPSPQTAAALLFRGMASTLVNGPLSQEITRRFFAEVSVDGDIWARQDFITVAVSAVEQIGLGFKPFYRCDEKPGAFAVVAVHSNPLDFVLEIPKIRVGKPMRRDKVIDCTASEIRFNPVKGKEADGLDYIVDGDTYHADGELVIKCGPELQFIELTGEATSELIAEGEGFE